MRGAREETSKRNALQKFLVHQTAIGCAPGAESGSVISRRKILIGAGIAGFATPIDIAHALQPLHA